MNSSVVEPKVFCSEPVLALILAPDSDPALALISDSNPGSDPALAIILDPGLESGMFLKNTSEFTLFFLKAQSILHPYLNCRSSKLRKKLIFF
jgi:hypothetical protein